MRRDNVYECNHCVEETPIVKTADVISEHQDESAGIKKDKKNNGEVLFVLLTMRYFRLLDPCKKSIVIVKTPT